MTSSPNRPRVRLTFVVDSREFGGAEAYVARLLRHLPERFECTVLATSPVPAPLRDEAAEAGVPVVLVDPVRDKLDALRLARQARALRATRPDLVHLNLPTVASSRHVLAVLALTGVPTVATLHIVAPLLSTVQRRILRRLYGRLPRLIAVSEETRRQFCAELGVPEGAVRIVPNGVEEAEPVARRSSRPLRIGASGRLTRQKGFDLLIEAVRGLVGQGVELEALIAGEGPERAALERQARGLPVAFAGFVADVPGFLAGLDVFCLPSRWEGLPFALLEAMMAGLPCVAAGVGDVAEAVGPAGMLVPADDVGALEAALRELAASPERRRELGAAAHARALERHSVERMVEETVRVYDEALAA